MKRIILTETQYKRLIKKRLNEQEVVFKDPKDEYDITNEMMQLLIHLKFYVDTMANKFLYIDKVENGVIYIDSSKYTKEEKDLINREIDIWVKFTDITSDKRTQDLTYNFGIDSDWDDLHPNDDVTVVDNNGDATDDVDLDNSDATDDVDLDDDSTTEIDYDPTKTYSRAEYIALVKDNAIKQMKKHKIPASITIAQGILESGDGNSGLARKGKNHFGIKCHSWTGEKIYLDTGEVNKDGSKRIDKGACFRKYDNISQSFDDHSKFLEKNSRYDSLFYLGTTDYKSWAEGLQKAGYATSPTYAKLLISIIEKHNLNKFDSNTTAPVVGCTFTSAELKYFNENIKNDDDNLNFRYWVNIDTKRLEKVNKKLSDCGLEDPKLSKKGSINDYLRHSFVLLGKDWVNAGKPKRPDEEVEVKVDNDKNGRINLSELTQVMNDVDGQKEYLSKAAAIQFNKMVADAKNEGVEIRLNDAYRVCGNPGDFEKGVWTQWSAWEDYKFHNGNLASAPVPSTKEEWNKGGGYCKSNHGFGNAIDVFKGEGREWVRKNCEKYGWYWGEVPSEDWHFIFCGEGVVNTPKYCKGKTKGKTETPKKSEEPKTKDKVLPSQIKKLMDKLKTDYGVIITQSHIDKEYEQEGDIRPDNGRVDETAEKKIKELIADCKSKFSNITGGIVSGYRSYEDQVKNFGNKVKGGRTIEDVQSANCLPGFSQHHTGKAFDIFSTDTSWWDSRPEVKTWVKNNCNKYGFEITYKTKGVLRVAEPWHLYYKVKSDKSKKEEVPEGEVPNNDVVNTYGFALGSKFPGCVDKGKVCYGGINGNWAGSMTKALEAASWLKVLNFNAGSQKRTRENTASGRRSDHWVKSIDSYGIDLPCNKSKGDAGYKKLREEFVKRGWITADEMPDKRLERGKGKWVNIYVGSYRYQIGWNVYNHYDHIHVGVRYNGKSKK